MPCAVAATVNGLSLPMIEIVPLAFQLIPLILSSFSCPPIALMALSRTSVAFASSPWTEPARPASTEAMNIAPRSCFMRFTHEMVKRGRARAVRATQLIYGPDVEKRFLIHAVEKAAGALAKEERF